MRSVGGVLIIFILITVSFSLSSISGSDPYEEDVSISRSFAGGTGTMADPYLIENIYQLQNITDDLSASFKLSKDIHAGDTQTWNQGEGFSPIGSGANPFSGILSGNGFTISYLKIIRENSENKGYFGLFSNIGPGGKVMNIKIDRSQIIGKEYSTGGIAGYNQGLIQNCRSELYVSGVEKVGGIAGSNTGTVYNCSFSGKVNGTQYLGGISGYNTGSLEFC